MQQSGWGHRRPFGRGTTSLMSRSNNMNMPTRTWIAPSTSNVNRPHKCQYPGCSNSFLAKRSLWRHEVLKHNRRKLKDGETDSVCREAPLGLQISNVQGMAAHLVAEVADNSGGDSLGHVVLERESVLHKADLALPEIANILDKHTDLSPPDSGTTNEQPEYTASEAANVFE